jgi:hypothetical protein
LPLQFHQSWSATLIVPSIFLPIILSRRLSTKHPDPKSTTGQTGGCHNLNFPTTGDPATMASSSFRDSMNSLGWSRRDTDVPVNTAQQTGLLSSIKSLNPFGDSGYVRLPTTEGAGAPLPARNRREEEDGWFVCESTFPPPLLCSTAPCVCQHRGPCATCSTGGWISFVLL